MRRTILITVNSLFLLCAGLWIGGIVTVGAMSAPIAFHDLQGIEKDGIAVAGVVTGHVLRRLNFVSVFLVAAMLGVSIFELFYRRRLNTKKLLLARALVVLVGFLVTFYLANVMMPRMETEMRIGRMDLFRTMHAGYRAWAMAQVLLGALSIVLTNAVNIGPRRDGGHPRDVK